MKSIRWSIVIEVRWPIQAKGDIYVLSQQSAGHREVRGQGVNISEDEESRLSSDVRSAKSAGHRAHPRTCTARVLHTLAAFAARRDRSLAWASRIGGRRSCQPGLSEHAKLDIRHPSFAFQLIHSILVGCVPLETSSLSQDDLPPIPTWTSSETSLDVSIDWPCILPAKRTLSAERLIPSELNWAVLSLRESFFAFPPRCFHPLPVSYTYPSMAMDIHGIGSSSLRFVKKSAIEASQTPSLAEFSVQMRNLFTDFDDYTKSNTSDDLLA
ncbi:hypothetical protein N7471_013663 [Penicillium samsonianum]|uniref:uncharacterized protein n=1 Tax=Penicillium samsonianum TaxID=1882272 RepID=UPI00254837A8|nr:uncharacterized protein N7471_013663 [Penicillium samsonianum]KAJ6118196.1 hypothetical protein N7471_013663 [Penicillium samsonianum]